MARLTGVLSVAVAFVACSAPASLFSLDERGLPSHGRPLERIESAPSPPDDPIHSLAAPEAPAPQPPAPPSPAPAPEAQASATGIEATADPDVLVATAKQTVVYARPSLKAPKLGYLRAGAVVHRSTKPAGFDGCRGGFYEVAPEGFVCVGSAASLDPDNELGRAVPRRADRTATMPYEYGAAAAAGVPLYSRIPALAEERAAEPSLGTRRGVSPSFDGLSMDEVPWFLRDGASSISTSGYRFSSKLVLNNAIAKSAFAFVSLFESSGRRFALTADMAVVPLDRLTRVTPSRFHGLPLGTEAALPVVFVRSKTAMLYSGDPLRGLKIVRALELREGIPITGKRVRAGQTAYLETRDGSYIVEQGLTRVDPIPSLPPWASGERSWIDVSIDRQALVAYEGSRAVFVTLVSTGIDGKGDPETTHSTIQGQFLIHTKHVTVTMDGDELGDEFDFRDVPYVQYFKEGFAIHAAYWHDSFGLPKSHGCVNVSPLDARWLFAWTVPSVPLTWHGAMSTHGTLVSIHP